jgi:hypothetical protein
MLPVECVNGAVLNQISETPVNSLSRFTNLYAEQAIPYQIKTPYPADKNMRS